MYYVVFRRVIWASCRTYEKAAATARKLGAMPQWIDKGYIFDVAKIKGRWAVGDNPAPRYYQPV